MAFPVGAAIQVAGAASSLFSKGGGGANYNAAIQSAQGGVTAAKEGLASTTKRLNKHSSLYGKVERDVARAASNLNADSLTSQGLQHTRRAFQQKENRVKANAAMRGLSDKSGLTQQQLVQLEIAEAEAEAEIRYSAPLKALQIQTAALQPALQKEAFLTQAQVAQTGQVVSATGQLTQANLAQAGAQEERQGFGIASLISAASPGSGGKDGKGSAFGDLASYIGSLA